MATSGAQVMLADGRAGLLADGRRALFSGSPVGCDPCCASEPSTGACCLADGSCADVTQAQCASLGGSFHGPGTTCAVSPCSPVLGACCLPGGGCANANNEVACINLGGVYQGAGTNCASVSCPQDPPPPQATGTCCDQFLQPFQPSTHFPCAKPVKSGPLGAMSATVIGTVTRSVFCGLFPNETIQSVTVPVSLSGEVTPQLNDGGVCSRPSGFRSWNIGQIVIPSPCGSPIPDAGQDVFVSLDTNPSFQNVGTSQNPVLVFTLFWSLSAGSAQVCNLPPNIFPPISGQCGGWTVKSKITAQDTFCEITWDLTATYAWPANWGQCPLSPPLP